VLQYALLQYASAHPCPHKINQSSGKEAAVICLKHFPSIGKFCRNRRFVSRCFLLEFLQDKIIKISDHGSALLQ
jgi:hypothetical protein